MEAIEQLCLSHNRTSSHQTLPICSQEFPSTLQTPPRRFKEASLGEPDEGRAAAEGCQQRQLRWGLRGALCSPLLSTLLPYHPRPGEPRHDRRQLDGGRLPPQRAHFVQEVLAGPPQRAHFVQEVLAGPHRGASNLHSLWHQLCSFRKHYEL